MVVGIFGENCSGKTTLAEAIRDALGGTIYSGKDYLRMAKSPGEAEKRFRMKLEEAVQGENAYYVISEPQQLRFLPQGAVRILVQADLDTIKARFGARMKGNLPVAVERMLERNHGMFDGEACDYRFDSVSGDAMDVVESLKGKACRGMKTIGLIGGMSWESTVTYYRIINETVAEKLGGLHSAKILMYSVDFDEIERCQSSGEWDRSADILADAARRLEAAGADFIVICTNTMHKVASQVRAAVTIPLLHIAEVTAQKLKEAGIATVGLLGTAYTMTQAFYVGVLKEAGIDVLVPEGEDIQTVNDIIFDELCVGTIRAASKQHLLSVIEGLRGRGAQGVILGCTELGLLVGPADVDLSVFDTAVIHARAAALEALR